MAKIKQERKKAVGYGYVIADAKGRIQLYTFRPNRAECWAAFLMVSDPAEKKRAMSEGFRAVPGYFRELGGMLKK